MITDGILIYSINEKNRIEYKTIIRSEYFDFLPAMADFEMY